MLLTITYHNITKAVTVQNAGLYDTPDGIEVLRYTDKTGMNHDVPTKKILCWSLTADETKGDGYDCHDALQIIRRRTNELIYKKLYPNGKYDTRSLSCEVIADTIVKLLLPHDRNTPDEDIDRIMHKIDTILDDFLED